MPDPNANSPQRDSAIDAVREPLDREFAIEEWKSTQESIEQFNDLGLRMRVFGISGVFLVAGFGIQNVKDDRLLFGNLHSSALIVLVSVALLGVVYFLDRRYYTSLLIAAVNYGQELERALRGDKEILDRQALQRMNEVDLPEGRKKNPDIAITSIWGKSAYISHYISRVHPSLYITIDGMYVILTILLFVTAFVLNCGLSQGTGRVSEGFPF
jgi:hypothetical protein